MINKPPPKWDPPPDPNGSVTLGLITKLSPDLSSTPKPPPPTTNQAKPKHYRPLGSFEVYKGKNYDLDRKY